MVKTSILIVTNEGKVAHELRVLLIKLGYRVVGIATSNDEILAKIEETKPDLILTDIRLNGVREGIKTGELIQSTYNTQVTHHPHVWNQKLIV